MNMSVYQFTNVYQQVSLVFPCQVAKAQAHDALLESEAWAPGITWAPGVISMCCSLRQLMLSSLGHVSNARQSGEIAGVDFWCRFQTKIIQNRHNPRSKKCVWLFVLAIPKPFGFTCVLWSPSVLDSVSFAALLQNRNIMESYCKLLQYHIKFEPPGSRCFFFFQGSDGPHCEALLSCCHSLSSSGMASSIEQCSHAMPDFRCCFSSCGITSASWFILDLLGTSQDLRDKAQRDDPWWSMM